MGTYYVLGTRLEALGTRKDSRALGTWKPSAEDGQGNTTGIRGQGEGSDRSERRTEATPTIL